MSSTFIDKLESKRSELKAERRRIRQRLQKRLEEIDEQIEALNKTRQVFIGEAEAEEHDAHIPDWPTGASMPEKVTRVLDHVGKIMQPREVDRFVRANSEEDVRDNAVAETLSRLARRDKIARKDYGKSSSFYGLSQWFLEEEEDFAPSVKPDRLSGNMDLLSQNN